MTSRTTTLVATLAALSILGACSSSDDSSGSSGDGDAAADAGGTGGKGSGGRGSGGSGTGTGGSGAGTGGSGTGGSGTGTGGSGASPLCTVAVAVPCDGSEDCPSGQMCCGQWNDRYVEFGCHDSCAALASDSGQATWFQLCHGGDTCEDTAAQCLTSQYLPTSLSRCYDTGSEPDPTLAKGAGEVNCGGDVCGAGEQCCLRGAAIPYCAPAGAACECTPTAPPDAGSDASTPDGSTGPDASGPDAGADAARPDGAAVSDAASD
ncbi:MAG: hypothetical protein FJ104_09240 [Deltaproteobacteria bacterium]|nr:hypothetical protein [Deltaproteobacteria bacterium]